MSEDPQVDSGAVRGGAAPRSTLWRGILGAAPVISTAITLELGRTLVVDSFGDVEAVQALADTLRVFSVLLVAGGLLFAGHRWYSRHRDGEQLARKRELLDGLEESGKEVDGIPHLPPAPRPTMVAGQEWLEAAILREIPMLDYDSAALLAVAAAIVEAQDRLPAEDSPSSLHTATALLDRWRSAGVLTEPAAHHYRLSTVPENPPRPSVRADPAWAAALCALVRHHAEHASIWAVALGHCDHARTARRWFTATAPALHKFAAACVAPTLRRQLPASALPELVRVLDALEVWYAGSAADTDTWIRFAGLCRAVAAAPGMNAFPLQHDLLELRGGRMTAPPRRYRPLRWSTGVAARWTHDHALRGFDGAPEHADAVADDLERVWWMLPRTDIEAEVCVLINLAVVELTRGRFEAAGDRLDLVFARTEGGSDPGGRVHAHEIMGIVHWARGESVPALRSWRRALTGYKALDDRLGTGRCLRHLGSALVVAPELGGTAIASNPASSSNPAGSSDPATPLPRAEVWSQAAGWLIEADLCSPLDSGSALAQENYSSRVRACLASASPPTAIGPWPLELDDPHLRIPRREP